MRNVYIYCEGPTEESFYLITLPRDRLAKKERVTMEDLAGRTLMIGGGSPPALKKVQQRIIAGGRVNYFNSADHETTLTNVAAEKGICLSPGFLNDHNPEFAWTPFDCQESISCVLCTHREDQRPIVREFVALLRGTIKQHAETNKIHIFRLDKCSFRW